MSQITFIDPSLTIYQTLPITGVNTVAQLRLIPNANSTNWTQRALAMIFGRAAALDGDRALYMWDPSSSAADDGALVIKPTAVTGAGRWRFIAGYGGAGLVPTLFAGSGSPEGVVTAAPGSIYTDTATGNLYKKVTGTGNTGWA